MQLKAKGGKLEGDLTTHETFSVRQHAGVKVIEFVNLAALTPALLMVSGLREFPGLQEVCVYNCLQFPREKVHQLIPGIQAAIEEAHGISNLDHDRRIAIDWSICRPSQDGPFLKVNLFKAWPCFLYRGAKNLRSVSMATDINPTTLVDLTEHSTAKYRTVVIDAAYDLACIWLWRSFADVLKQHGADNTTQVQVLQRRLLSLCACHCGDDTPKSITEHLKFWNECFGLHDEAALVDSGPTTLKAIEDAAIKLDSLRGTHTWKSNAPLPKMACHICKHEDLPVVFFPKTDVKEFKKSEGENKAFTCWGCKYDQDVRDYAKHNFVIPVVPQELEKHLQSANINSIQGLANEVVKIARVPKSSKKDKKPNNIRLVENLFPNAMPEKFISAIFVNPIPDDLLTSFGTDSKHFDDPELTKLLPEFLRMCPHKLES